MTGKPGGLPFPKPVRHKKPRKRLTAVGAKSKAWSQTRADLKVRFEQTGITQCELRYSGCWVSNALSFAHSRKRRYITSQEELEECIVACTRCHNTLEYGGNMYEIVRRVIASRKVAV